MNENELIKSIDYNIDTLKSALFTLLEKSPHLKCILKEKLTDFTQKIIENDFLTNKDFKYIVLSYLKNYYNVIDIVHIEFFTEEDDECYYFDFHMHVKFDFGIISLKIGYGNIECTEVSYVDEIDEINLPFDVDVGYVRNNQTKKWAHSEVDDYTKLYIIEPDALKFVDIFSKLLGMYTTIKEKYYNYPIRKVQRSVHALLLCRKYSSDHPIMLMDKNITLIIAKYLWSTREEFIWN